MEIHLDKRAVKHIRLSAQDAIEEGDTEALREDILEAFSEEQVEEIERRLDASDFFEFLTDTLDEWSVDDVDELFELLETQLSDIGIDLKYDAKVLASKGTEGDEDEEDDFEDDGDEDGEDDVDEDALPPDDEDDLTFFVAGALAQATRPAAYPPNARTPRARLTRGSLLWRSELRRQRASPA